MNCMSTVEENKAEILIATNISREGPATIATVLQERGFSSTVVNLEVGEIFPSPRNYGALIVMGGPYRANDPTPKMQHELVRIREALDANIPYLGVCLGMQTLVKAAGGDVVKSPCKEIGFRDPEDKFFAIHLTPEGRKDPLFAGLAGPLPVFHLHGETVELHSEMNPQATLLATAEVVPNQVVKVGDNAYGLQGHFELTSQLLERWLHEDPDLLNLGERGIEQVRADFQKLQEEYTQTGRTIFNNFLNL